MKKIDKIWLTLASYLIDNLWLGVVCLICMFCYFGFGNDYSSNDKKCKSFESITHLRIEYFSQRCSNNNANIYGDVTLVYRTDEKHFTMTATHFIRDCRGNKRYYMKAGGFVESIIDTKQIYAPLIVYFSNDTVHSYIDTTIEINNLITLKDTTGNVIADINFDNKIDSLRWQWDCNIYRPEYIDMFTLISIVSNLGIPPPKISAIISANN